MLLTSSQASVAVSGLIVVAFTTALFLSGYAIQQRTLRDLRAAIRPPPRPSPQVYIPDVFMKPPDEPGKQDAAGQFDQPGADRAQAPLGMDRSEPAPPVIEVKQSVPAATSGESIEGDADSRTAEPEIREPPRRISRVERRKRIKDEIKRLSHDEKPVYWQRRLW